MRKLFLQVLSLIGLFDSIYLLWEYTSPNRPMVCMGGGCDAVRASSYAHFAGLPTPVYGAVMYCFLALLIFLFPLLPASLARLSEYGIAIISGAGFLVSAYLTGIEGFVIHSWCMWCLISAVTVTLILILTVVDLARPRAPLDAPQALAAVQKQFAIVLFAVVAGVPGFVMLTRNSSIPVKSPSAKVAKVHMVRPDTYFYGDPHAPVTVVEFGDFECPACGEAEKSAQEIRKHFGNRIRFAFREFPLKAIHPYAEKAAEASECAGQQGKFWQAVNMLYEHQSDLKVPALKRYAREMGLNTQKFDACLQSGKMVSRINQDIADGHALGVHATPTFFVDGNMIVGPIPYPKFKLLVDNELSLKSGAQMASSTVEPEASKKAVKPQPVANKEKTAKTEKENKTGKAQASATSSNNTMQVFGGSSGLLASLQQNSATACSDAEAKERQPRMIGTSQAKALYGEKPEALFVDVRPAKAFQSGHIPGALNIPIGTFLKDWHRLPKKKTIVLYQGGHSTGDICAASRSAGRILLTQGFGYSEVKVYRDGLAGWTKAGLPVQR